MTTERLNFSWLVDGEIAGHAAPASVDDLACLKARGIQAMVRMEEETGGCRAGGPEAGRAGVQEADQEARVT